jgi:hypothetical protein
MKRLQRKAEPARVDVEHEATEAICLVAFRAPMRRAVDKGERLARDHDLVRSFPQFFGLLLPLTELEEVS